MRRFTLAAVLVLAVVVTGVTLGGAQPRFDWKQAQGTEIRVLALRVWFTDHFKASLPEFERLTGIRVVFEDYPEDALRQKLAVEMAARNKNVDVFQSGASFEGKRFSTSGWYSDLGPMLRDPSATSPEWDQKDFFDSVWKAQQFGGQQVSVPLQAVTQVMFYRKDLFDAAGLKPPRTLDELEAAAKRLHAPPAVYGFVSRGRKTQAPYSWAHFLYAHGGSWFSPDGKSALATPAALTATNQYARVLRSYGDPGATDNGPVEVQTLFLQGRAAMIVDACSWAGIFNNAEKSKVVGKWAVAPAPAGPAGVTYELWAWSMSISPFSEKKRAAWLFVQWATSKEMQRPLQARGFPMPRRSLWNDPEWRAKVDASWLQTVTTQFASARPIGHPAAIAAAEVVDQVGTAINGVLAGKDARAELDAAARSVNAVIERTEKR
jgi:multiple sugar transport system substrate-binding protein